MQSAVSYPYQGWTILVGVGEVQHIVLVPVIVRLFSLSWAMHAEVPDRCVLTRVERLIPGYNLERHHNSGTIQHSAARSGNLGLPPLEDRHLFAANQ